MQGRQASIWGLLNHLRLTHPSAALVGKQLVGQQPVDRTLTGNADACKPDRCSGTVVAAISDAEHGNNVSNAYMVSVGPHGSIRCSSPVLRSPRVQQQKKRQAANAPCPYHDRETITVSLVRESGMYTPPQKSVSPQRNRRSPSLAKHKDVIAHSCKDGESYVRVVAVGPAVGGHKHGPGRWSDKQDAQHQQHGAMPQRCPEPAAAASQSSRRNALAQLRMARHRQQQQLVPADVQQQVNDKMSDRSKQGAGAQWSSRKANKEQHSSLSELGEACKLL